MALPDDAGALALRDRPLCGQEPVAVERSQELQRYTENTITDRVELDRQLETVRQAGYALCEREYEEFSSGASAAVLSSRQYPMVVINIWGPAPRNPLSRLHELGLEAVRTAQLVRGLLD